MSKDVYMTLLLTDSYLAGALVLAQCLKENNCRYERAIMVVNTLSEESIKQVSKVYDYVLKVDPIGTTSNNHSTLLKRPDLSLSYTKLQLWNQTQFRKVVFLDADCMVIKNIDELFNVPINQDGSQIAAAPDSGWPDIFNSGMFVTYTSNSTFNTLVHMAKKNISFDGCDQGVLNIFFNHWHRLPFSYNVTPSNNYEYIPAYMYFHKTISVLHFIGAAKPWTVHLDSVDSTYQKLIFVWWKILINNFPEIANHLKKLYGSGLSDSLLSTINSDGNSTLNSSINLWQDSYSSFSSRSEFETSYVWDPANSEPPKHTRPEGEAFSEHSYPNVWDTTDDPNKTVVGRGVHYHLRRASTISAKIFDRVGKGFGKSNSKDDSNNEKQKPWSRHEEVPTRHFKADNAYEINSDLNSMTLVAGGIEVQEEDQEGNASNSRKTLFDRYHFQSK